ncbi:hypothetical protein BB559_000831 [Furculomyces boomerangus]|uniref:Dolichyl-phosphate-mannose--protein mannosyltransferase n=1 Tax=Furculomyces boomerangus TaxID=61424 RepID=A0A2T9Z3W7_9FUNG|nr:hypothetical protein BB559_000831 [Furculomyces boomerangus]
MSTITRRKPRLIFEDSDTKEDLFKTQTLPLSEDYKDNSKPRTQNVFFTKKEFGLDKIDYICLVVLTALSLFTRLYQIGKRKSVTWDESHFGKFGAYYLNRTFYGDVHPPLAKMLVGLAELIAGHDGRFNFKGDYPSYVNFTFMRAQIALYGAALVPISFVTLKALGISRKMAFLGGIFILFDNAICLMSRFILLDEPLLFFTSTTLLFVTLFYTSNSFTTKWYVYLFSTGLSMGMVLSSKWVGLFCVALVGLATIEDLYLKFGDLKMPKAVYTRHWCVRIAAFIVVPLSFYMFTFKLHFMILNKSGPGDKDMTPAFQAHLKNNNLGVQSYLVAFGSKLSIRSMKIGNGYLHSHSTNYPSGSNRQQITCYGYDDDNGKWIVESSERNPGYNYTANTEDGNPQQPIYVNEGEYVRLRHEKTNQYLGMDIKHQSLVTKSDKEASCMKYEDAPHKDALLWKFEIVDDEGMQKSNRIRTISVTFTLKNKFTGMHLRAPGTTLPPWGFDQMEVCGSKSTGGDDYLWIVEKNTNPLVMSTKIKVKKPGFLKSFIYLNMKMARSNNALIPDRDKYNHLESDPITWPFLIFPMRLLGSWNPGDIKYYEIGNPITWWSSTAASLLFPIHLILLIIVASRSKSQEDHTCLMQYWNRGKFLWFGWALHYFPFFLMGRVTYIHHYLPALYFAYLTLAFEIDFIAGYIELKTKLRTRTILFLVWGFLSILGFMLYMPFTFGYTQNARNLKYRQWLPTWNIYEDYHKM